jgi:hypothetical protein
MSNKAVSLAAVGFLALVSEYAEAQGSNAPEKPSSIKVVTPDPYCSSACKCNPFSPFTNPFNGAEKSGKIWARFEFKPAKGIDPFLYPSNRLKKLIEAHFKNEIWNTDISVFETAVQLPVGTFKSKLWPGPAATCKIEVAIPREALERYDLWSTLSDGANRLGEFTGVIDIIKDSKDDLFGEELAGCWINPETRCSRCPEKFRAIHENDLAFYFSGAISGVDPNAVEPEKAKDLLKLFFGKILEEQSIPIGPVSISLKGIKLKVGPDKFSVGVPLYTFDFGEGEKGPRFIWAGVSETFAQSHEFDGEYTNDNYSCRGTLTSLDQPAKILMSQDDPASEAVKKKLEGAISTKTAASGEKPMKSKRLRAGEMPPFIQEVAPEEGTYVLYENVQKTSEFSHTTSLRISLGR